MKERQPSKERTKETMIIARKLAHRFVRGGLLDVDDVLQGTMLRVLQRSTKDEPTTGWLYKAVRSVAFDAMRQIQRERKYLAIVNDEAFPGSVCEVADEHGYVKFGSRQKEYESEAWTDLQEMLGSLSQPLRQVLILHAEGYSYTQISAITGTPVGTVRSRLHHARRQAQARLRE